jgi:hypothetical protein
VRRAHPDLPVYLSLPEDQLGKLYVGPPPELARLELERAWPSFVYPSGLQARQQGALLRLTHAQPGAELVVHVELARPGDYELHLEGVSGPEQGDWSVSFDGEPLAPWHGYAPLADLRETPGTLRRVGPGRHVLRLRCGGRTEPSAGTDALLDALVGVPR